MTPITLWQAEKVETFDDAGIAIIKSILEPPNTSGIPPYTLNRAPRTLPYVPSLAWFCIHSLLDSVDQLHQLGPARLTYTKPDDPASFDLLSALIPNSDLSTVDPRLWAVLAQLFPGTLPAALRTYSLPLADPHLPLLQRIPPSPQFAILTVLALPRCSALTDDTILRLRALPTLAALDAGGTSVSAWGIRTLAAMHPSAHSLRVLRLRDCAKVDDKVFSHLPSFALLSVVDLRGTRCLPTGPAAITSTFGQAPLFLHKSLYDTPLHGALDVLAADYPHIFPSPHTYFLRITTLRYPPTRPSPGVPASRPPGDLRRDVSPATFYAASRLPPPPPLQYFSPDDHDSRLMRFRPPPPWKNATPRFVEADALQGINKKGRAEAETSAAVGVNRTSAQALRGIAALGEMKRRRVPESSPAPVASAKEVRTSRNPFLRKVTKHSAKTGTEAGKSV